MFVSTQKASAVFGADEEGCGICLVLGFGAGDGLSIPEWGWLEPEPGGLSLGFIAGPEGGASEMCCRCRPEPEPRAKVLPEPPIWEWVGQGSRYSRTVEPE